MHPLLHEYNQKKVNFMQYNKWNNCIEKTCVYKPFYHCENVWEGNEHSFEGETNKEPT